MAAAGAPPGSETRPRGPSGAIELTRIAGSVVLGINRFMGLRSHAKAENPHGLAILPAAQSDMRGMLMKQGAKVNVWDQRYFVLQGSTIAHWESEEAAQAGEASTACGVGLVQTVERWPAGSKKPAQISEKTWFHHAACGFFLSTDEREFVLFTETEEEASRWVEKISAAIADTSASAPAAASEVASGGGTPRLGDLGALGLTGSGDGPASGRMLSRAPMSQQLDLETMASLKEIETEVGEIRQQVRRVRSSGCNPSSCRWRLLSPLTAHHSPLTTHRALLAAHCSLCTARCSSLTLVRSLLLHLATGDLLLTATTRAATAGAALALDPQRGALAQEPARALEHDALGALHAVIRRYIPLHAVACRYISSPAARAREHDALGVCSTRLCAPAACSTRALLPPGAAPATLRDDLR